ncbi:hypothetical protein K0M31_007846 [Melipona bicolor]|uniref:Uncharacterized protein n=1 Tax=Melipona bicolor TaxID=60889 RepID=A0AA40KW10_9HYME|nr:hypothetical protein K0M31_007846 [Melipona bicolor]
MESKVDRNGVLNPWQRSSRENRLSWRTAAAEKGSCGGGRWISLEEGVEEQEGQYGLYR